MCLLKTDCPFCGIICERKVTSICVATRMSPVGQQRGWVTGSLCGRAGTLPGRAAAIALRWRMEALGARASMLCVRATLHGRAGAWMGGQVPMSCVGELCPGCLNCMGGLLCMRELRRVPCMQGLAPCVRGLVP